MKGIRLLMICTLFLVPMLESPARPPQCDTALARCMKQCESFPWILRDGCVLGCGIGYLSCGD